MAPLGESSDWILGGVLLLIMLIDSVLATSLTGINPQEILGCDVFDVGLLFHYSSFSLVDFGARPEYAFTLLPKTRLLSILYSGCFGAGFQITIGAWCVKTKGPLFVAMFHPLGIVIAAILGVIFLRDGLYLGCVLGSLVIVIGFYGVMWAMAKEEKSKNGRELKVPPLAR